MTETENSPDIFLHKAKALVAAVYEPIGTEDFEDGKPITLDEIYVVWFAKVLGNWKALVSTSRSDGLYFEVTYDGNKNQSYVDTYVKIQNDIITNADYLGHIE